MEDFARFWKELLKVGPPKPSADSGIDCSILELSLHKIGNVAKCGNFTLSPVVGYYFTNITVTRSRKLRVFCVCVLGGGGGQFWRCA